MYMKHTFFTPIIFARVVLARNYANLLLAPEVQNINFRLGHVHVFPSHFRAVADGLRDGTLSVAFAAERLAKEDSDAEYHSGENTFFFRSDTILEKLSGRSTAVHEASHACADFRNRNTAIRQEEGAAFMCEAWYLLNLGIDPEVSLLPDEVVAVTKDMYARRQGNSPVNASGSEINAVRRAMAKLKYENGFYNNSGF